MRSSIFPKTSPIVGASRIVALASAVPPRASQKRRKRSFRERHWLRQASRQHRAGDEVRAFDFLSRAALAGDNEAQTAVGLAYLLGKGVPCHLGAAAEWLEHAATDGHVDAMVHLAKMALQGLIPTGGRDRPTPDLVTGRLWAAKAATAGAIEGKLLLANLGLFAPQGVGDIVTATTLFREAAEAGSGPGRLGLALALLHGDQARANRDDITRCIDQAAAQHVPMAMYFAGVMREFGAGLDRHLPQALELYRSAAMAGIRPAQTRYGFALLQGTGFGRDAVTGETWLRKAALTGDAVACGLVGLIYAAPGNLPPNHAEACLWFRRAEELGHTLAQDATRQAQSAAWQSSNATEAAWWVQHLRALGPIPPTNDPGTIIAKLV